MRSSVIAKGLVVRAKNGRKYLSSISILKESKIFAIPVRHKF